MTTEAQAIQQLADHIHHHRLMAGPACADCKRMAATKVRQRQGNIVYCAPDDKWSCKCNVAIDEID